MNMTVDVHGDAIHVQPKPATHKSGGISTALQSVLDGQSRCLNIMIDDVKLHI